MSYSPTVDSPLKKYSENNEKLVGISFQSPIIPKRLFQIDSTTPNQFQLKSSIPTIHPINLNQNTPEQQQQQQQQLKQQQHLQQQHLQQQQQQQQHLHQSFNQSFNQSISQSLNQSLNQSITYQQNHSSSKNLTASPSKQTPAPNRSIQFTPVKKPSIGSPSTPNLNYEHLFTPTTSQPSTLARQSSRIPISLNPQFNSTGVRLGRKRLLERIRINLISLVIVWVFTSTKFYNEIVVFIGSRIPILALPLRVIEWVFLAVIIGNLVEGYYKLKTQVPITHVELPLTPQQIRGSLKGSKIIATVGILSPNSAQKTSLSPFQRSINLSASVNTREKNTNKSGNKFNSTEDSPTSTKNIYNNHEILTKDPMMNPLKSSTNHLFKRSIFNNDLSNSTSAQSETNFLRHSFPAKFTATPHAPFTLSPALQNHQPQSSLSRSVRKVSNRESLHKLLEETLAA